MDKDTKIIVLKIVCLIFLLSGCLFLFSSCSTVSEMVYGSDDEEKACQYTYKGYDFIASLDEEHKCDTCLIRGLYVLDDEVSDDEILLDVMSSLDNGIVSINYGTSYKEDSMKLYSPVKNFKLTKAGVYYIFFEIDFNIGLEEEDKTWTGSTYCLEKGNHYLLVYDNPNRVIERYGD